MRRGGGRQLGGLDRVVGQPQKEAKAAGAGEGGEGGDVRRMKIGIFKVKERKLTLHAAGVRLAW